MNELKKVTMPNESQCEGCPNWDDVNGCWDNVKDVDYCLRIGRSGYYGNFYYGDFDDINKDYEDLNLMQCSCRFCNCQNETEFGEVCSECCSGAHQG